MPTIAEYNQEINDANASIASLTTQLNSITGNSAVDISERERIEGELLVQNRIKDFNTVRRNAQVQAQTATNLANNPNVVSSNALGTTPNTSVAPSNTGGVVGTNSLIGKNERGNYVINNEDGSISELTPEQYQSVLDRNAGRTSQPTSSPQTQSSAGLAPIPQGGVVDAAGNFVAGGEAFSPSGTQGIATNLVSRVDRILDFINRGRQEQLGAVGEVRNAANATTRSQLDRLGDFFTQARRGILANQSVQQGIASGVGRRAGASTAQRLATQSNLQAQSQDQLGQLGLSQLENERAIGTDFVNRLGTIVDSENSIRSTADTNITNLRSGLASDLSTLGQNELTFQRNLADQLRQQGLEGTVGTVTGVVDPNSLLGVQQAAEIAELGGAAVGGTGGGVATTGSGGGSSGTTTYRTSGGGTTTVPTGSTPPADALEVIAETPPTPQSQTNNQDNNVLDFDGKITPIQNGSFNVGAGAAGTTFTPQPVQLVNPATQPQTNRTLRGDVNNVVRATGRLGINTFTGLSNALPENARSNAAQRQRDVLNGLGGFFNSAGEYIFG